MEPKARTALVVGLVGGIGSGKSQVAQALAARGAHGIDADALGHAALRQPDIRARVVGRCGTGVLDDAGAIDRRLLGQRVFGAPGELAELEKIVFPYIERRIGEEIRLGRAQGAPCVALDAAIMLEKGWAKVCDRILFVDTPRPLRLERLMKQRGWSEEELLRRERSQWSVEEKRRHADAVLANDAGPEALAQQLDALLSAWGVAAPALPSRPGTAPARPRAAAEQELSL